MGKTVMLKRAHASLDDEVAFLIEKINYLLRKVESYDRALNEFTQIKLIIDEAEKNTRLSKDIVRESKDACVKNATDIGTLVQLISTLTERFDSRFDYLKDKLFVLSDREINHKDELEKKIIDSHEVVMGILNNYLTVADHDISEEAQKEHDDCIDVLISNIKFNHWNLENEVRSLKNLFNAQGDRIISLQKDLCRFQNALVRKGVPIDNQ